MRWLSSNRMAVRFVIAALLVVRPGLGTVAAEPAVQWKFNEGETLRVRIRARSEIQIEAAPPQRAPRDPAPSIDVTFVWKVTRVRESGAAEVTQTIEHVREEANERSPEGQRMAYDSRDPKTIDNPWSALKQALYAPVLGSPYRLTIDRRGDVTAVELPRDVLKGWKSFSLEPGDSRDYLFTKGGLEALLCLSPRLPAAPLGDGAGWRSERERTAGRIRTTLVESYAPTGRHGSVQTFEARPEVGMKLIREAPEPPDPPVRSRVRAIYPTDVMVERQSGTSRFAFDAAAGRPASFSRRQRYTLRYSFADRPAVEGTREIRETIVRESDGTIESKEAGR